MLILALLMAGASTTTKITGDFDRDGRGDRVVAEKKGDTYTIIMYRSFGDNKVVETNVPMSEDFTIKKVNRVDRRAVCDYASLSRYTCDSGDVLQYGNGVQSAMAIWNGQRFIVYRPQVGGSTGPTGK